jgi:hypothetical protein
MDRSTTTRSHPFLLFRHVAIAAWLVTLLGAAFVVAESPVLVGFGLAVAAAYTWCFWLDRHDSAHDMGPVPGPEGGLRVAPRAQPPVLAQARRHSPRVPESDKPAPIKAA